tara:strand:+ start:2775 stop:3173 length:399 start_codon:yes stop_codon:yes gene_type:complete
MPSYVYSSGMNKVISDGKVIKDNSYEMKYDGKEMNIKKTNKNKTKKIKLTEKDISELLHPHTDSLSLEERLLGELNKSHSKDKTKQKKNKTKKNKGGAKKKNETNKTSNINDLTQELNNKLNELKKLLNINN